MRLIDADAMYDEFVQKPSIYDTTDLPDMLGDMPTIDAIPVEWVKQKAIAALDPFSPYMMVMFAWYKEQKEREEKSE